MKVAPTEEKLYALPEYYDVAFSWDLSREIKLFREIFERHVPFKVEHILEPACGTGRFLLTLPGYGYRVTGYDISAEMVAYAQRRIKERGLQQVAKAMVADMRSARFRTKSDAAINSINSLGYLLSDDDILSHLCNTGESLRTGGVYIVHLACAWDELDPHQGEGWVMEREGIRVNTTWEIERQDRQHKLSHQLCRMTVEDHGKRRALEDRHTLRLWFFEDLSSLIQRSGKFRLAAIYDQAHRQVPLDSHISGELGNLYWVLEVL
jgi:SAM-dependent methyltransferase